MFSENNNPFHAQSMFKPAIQMLEEESSKQLLGKRRLRFNHSLNLASFWMSRACNVSFLVFVVLLFLDIIFAVAIAKMLAMRFQEGNTGSVLLGCSCSVVARCHLLS